MPMREARETVLPFRHARGEGAIVFDPEAWPQTQAPSPGTFQPAQAGDSARPVDRGGRGAAWFVDTPAGEAVLRHYLRGGLVARLSRDAYVWRGEHGVRSFAEFRLLQALRMRGLPVPAPLAAAYWRSGRHYRAAILLARIAGARTFAQRVEADPATAPWQACGELIARFHLVGLEHADLNAHNLLFDPAGDGWMIDFDKGRLRADHERGWREANLSRLRRSLDKLDAARAGDAIEHGFARLREAYQDAWAKGVPR